MTVIRFAIEVPELFPLETQFLAFDLYWHLVETHRRSVLDAASRTTLPQDEVRRLVDLGAEDMHAETLAARCALAGRWS